MNEPIIGGNCRKHRIIYRGLTCPFCAPPHRSRYPGLWLVLSIYTAMAAFYLYCRATGFHLVLP
jgi:hypothetical protein